MSTQADKLSLLQQLKAKKNAVILAHYYTMPEVQAAADFVGDSLALAQAAAQTDADIILFAGVHFMAETAKILNPTKKVLLPEFSAGCSLADSCPADKLAAFMQQHPDHLLLSYINCSAAVKAMSYCIVTSGNALRVVDSMPKDAKIIFAPDRWLGSFINRELDRHMILWDGACHVHDQLTADDVLRMTKRYPNALVLAHPECRPEVQQNVDFVGSTAAMLKYVKNSDHEEFVVLTEEGILYEMRKQNPDKILHALSEPEPQHVGCVDCLECKYMKMNNLDNMIQVLTDETPELLLDAETIEKARIPIERMLTFK